MIEILSPDPQPALKPRRLRPTLWIPVTAVAVVVGFLSVALRSGDPSQLPSALIGKPAPDFNLPQLALAADGKDAGRKLSSGVLHEGQPALVNIWASWCAPCQAEHPVLMDLAQRGTPIYGIDYKDKPEAARRILTKLGNPYRAIAADDEGFTAIDFGVYGVPETFVIDGQGRIVYRHPGPLSPEIVAAKILPAMERAKTAK